MMSRKYLNWVSDKVIYRPLGVWISSDPIVRKQESKLLKLQGIQGNTSSRRQVCGLKFVFGREEGGSQVSHLLQGFFAFILKHFTEEDWRLEPGHVTS